ncbi:MAG TPA: SRPBCC family protein [Anaerolineae bacterium]
MANQITKSIIVKSDVTDVFDLWSSFEHFPHFMKYIKSVTKTGPRTSHWEVEGPLGTTAKWDAEMTRLDENKRIAWNSKDHEGNVTTSGQVTFNALPNDETEVTVLLQYTPPAGKAGELITNLFSDPEERLEEDLRNFKSFAEGKYNRIWS